MTFIVTSDGAEVCLRYPRTGQLTARTIAHSLSQINRFTGHASRPYSVAEHSLLVCDIVERVLHLDVHAQLAALMHDAHECVAGDMHTPGKREVQGWDEWEYRWTWRVRSEYALLSVFAKHGSDIRHADRLALAIERRDLMPSSPTPWEVLTGIEPIGWMQLNTPEREAMTWREWAAAWHDRYEALDFARNEALFGGEPDSGFTL